MKHYFKKLVRENYRNGRMCCCISFLTAQKAFFNVYTTKEN